MLLLPRYLEKNIIAYSYVPATVIRRNSTFCTSQNAAPARTSRKASSQSAAPATKQRYTYIDTRPKHENALPFCDLGGQNEHFVRDFLQIPHFQLEKCQFRANFSYKDIFTELKKHDFREACTTFQGTHEMLLLPRYLEKNIISYSYVPATVIRRNSSFLHVTKCCACEDIAQGLITKCCACYETTIHLHWHASKTRKCSPILWLRRSKRAFRARLPLFFIFWRKGLNRSACVPPNGEKLMTHPRRRDDDNMTNTTQTPVQSQTPTINENPSLHIRQKTYTYIIDSKYIEYGIGVVTIFIGHQELELKTTYIESDKFIHRIFFPILKILLGTQRIHQLPHETNRIGAEMEPVRSRIQTGSTFFHLSQGRVRQQQARGNKDQKQRRTFPVTFYYVKPFKKSIFWRS